MAADLIISPEAADDIGEAYAWYEQQRAGLGEEFLSCVDACLQTICRMPEVHSKVHEDYRRGLMRRFPYAVFYEHDSSAVTVYCVFHAARDPAKWRQRLP
jgi:plasmid stabilization system protein ParE